MAKRTPVWLPGSITTDRTVTRHYWGEDLASMMARRLVALSCWFQVEPYPDGMWVFTLKSESGLLAQVDLAANECLDVLYEAHSDHV